MKPITLILVFILFSSSKSHPQTSKDTDDLEKIKSIFDQIEVQGVDTKQNLLYGYFFMDKDKLKLNKLKDELLTQSYRFVELDKKYSGTFMLHVEKLEKHTRKSLQEREQKLRAMAAKYNISSFDGFDIGNADSAKPLISEEDFSKFMATKKGNELFGLGMKLYELEINDKAELVFKACLKQKIKPDTSAYKLGNILINENNLQQGIDYLVQATRYNPSYMYAYFNFGATFYDIRQFQKSIEYYQQADRLKPNDDRIIYGIAASQYGIQQYDKSLENCKKALQINNNKNNVKHLLQMLKNKSQ